MLHRVAIKGIQFPRLYIAENADDVNIARANGIPYVRWKYGQDELLRMLLRPTLEKMFPGIDWDKVLGEKRNVRSEVHICHGNISNSVSSVSDYDKDEMLSAQYEYDKKSDKVSPIEEQAEYTRLVPVAKERRDIINDNSYLGYEYFAEDKLSIEDYVGDLTSSVNIEALQKLNLLPKFMGDVADCIKHNLSQSMYWTEGYTKKLGYPLGNCSRRKELPNLLIIDISSSIPDGIAATMITLADTLRSQLNAELIITSNRSGYYSPEDELPNPQTLRNYYGRNNESAEFFGILKKHIAGKEYGHVISFGDYDCPGSIWNAGLNHDLANTKVHCIHHYHTGKLGWLSSNNNCHTGYALWAEEVSPDAETIVDTSWCKVMNKNYKMPE